MKVRFLHVERRVRGIILECNVLAHSNLKTEKFDATSTTMPKMLQYSVRNFMLRLINAKTGLTALSKCLDAKNKIF